MENRLDNLLQMMRLFRQEEDKPENKAEGRPADDFYSLLMHLAQGGKAESEPPSFLVMAQAFAPFLPPESRHIIDLLQEVTENQKFILAQMQKTGVNGGVSPEQLLAVLVAVRPRVPQHKQRTVDILIKFTELGVLIRQ